MIKKKSRSNITSSIFMILIFSFTMSFFLSCIKEIDLLNYFNISSDGNFVIRFTEDMLPIMLSLIPFAALMIFAMFLLATRGLNIVKNNTGKVISCIIIAILLLIIGFKYYFISQIPYKDYEMVSTGGDSYLIVNNSKDFLIVKDYNKGISFKEIVNKKEYRKISRKNLKDAEFTTVNFSER